MASKTNLITRSGSFRSILRGMRAIPETIDAELLYLEENISASCMISSGIASATEDAYEWNEKATEDVELSRWKTILHYIYFEPIHIDCMENGWKLLECARRFELKQLESKVFDVFLIFIDQSNCSEIIVRADDLSLPAVRTKAFDVLNSEFYAF